MRKSKKTGNKAFKYFYIVAALVTVFFTANLQGQSSSINSVEEDSNYKHEFIHGKVEKVVQGDQKDEMTGKIKVELTVLAHCGEEKGKIVKAPVSSMNNFNTYKKGDEVQVFKMTDTVTKTTKYEVSDYYHQSGLIWIFIIFATVIIVIARKKGITAILSVIISLLLFYFLLIKMIVIGYSPIVSALTFTAVVTLITIPLIHGFNRKSISAIISIFAGYIFSIIVSFYFTSVAGLGNTPGEEFRMLGVMYPQLAISAILLSSVFLGAIGALIDTAISISSAIFEAVKDHPNQTFKKVYKIGMEVGKDVLGSMINTLMFAYLASSMPLLIMIALSKGVTASELVNMDFIALELTRTFVGALSLVILIPIAAAISAHFFVKNKTI